MRGRCRTRVSSRNGGKSLEINPRVGSNSDASCGRLHCRLTVTCRAQLGAQFVVLAWGGKVSVPGIFTFTSLMLREGLEEEQITRGCNGE
jgi:hypothetical protein